MMSALAGNLQGFEEAARALYARNREKFLGIVNGCPTDVGRYFADRTRELSDMGSRAPSAEAAP